MIQTFSINPRVIAHLGEALIKNESIALLELIKNSYDANASRCKIRFDFDINKKLSKITIVDDGDGMDEETIRGKWLVIGTDNKKTLLDECLSQNSKKRVPLGEKGIGRLGVHKLGNKIKLTTRRKQGDEVLLEIDWNLLNSAKSIDDFKIEENVLDEPKIFLGSSHGTKIEIEEVKGVWDRRKLRDVYRNIVSLNSPFEDSDDSFSVEVVSNSNLFDDLPDAASIKSVGMYYAHCELDGDRIVKLNYSFKPWNTLEKIEKGRNVTIKKFSETPDLLLLMGEREVEDEDGKTKRQKYTIDLNQNGVGPISLDLVIFEPDTQIIGLMNLEKKTFQSYMRANGGIRVYRDGIRVLNYGEPGDDWLQINEKRIHKLGGNISNQIVLGAVKLDRKKSVGLKEKTNREGFVENDAYNDLVNAVQQALNLVVTERNTDKALLSLLYKENKVIEPVLSDLNEVTQLINEKVTNDDDKQEMLKCLRKISDQYTFVRDTLLRSANAGLNLGAIVHEVEKQIAVLKGCVKHKDSEGVKGVSERLDVVIRNAMSLLKKSDIKRQNLNVIVDSVIQGLRFRFSDHNITPVFITDSSEIFAQVAESALKNTLTNLVDNSIFWLSLMKKENKRIAIYVTTQMEKYNCIVVSDNGPGFTIPESIAVEPFVSGKPNNMGTGLGLHICKELMKSMGGKLEFCDVNDYSLPSKIMEEKITKAMIALCFPK